MSDEQRVYRLENEHDWADIEEFQPERPDTPDELQPLHLCGDEVDYVDDLRTYSDHNDQVRFYEDQQAVQATPAEVAEWQRRYAEVEKAQGHYRQRMAEALTAYEMAHRDAVAELNRVTQSWWPVERELETRSLQLAVLLSDQRQAAEQWKEERDAREQAHLDTIHGPRVLVLYSPSNLSGRNKAGHVAKVHLVDCGRRRGTGRAVRANAVWEELTNPKDLVYGHWPDAEKNLRIKLCASCKPWTVLIEWLGLTAEDFHKIKLDDWPDGLADDLNKQNPD